MLPPLIIKFRSNFLSNPQGKNLYTIKEWLIIIMMAKSKEEQGLIQEKIEDLLRDNPSRSYSKEEIINLLSSDLFTKDKIDRILGEMEIGSSMNDVQLAVYSSFKGGTVYFQWGQTP